MNEVEFKFKLKIKEYERLMEELNETLVETLTYWNIFYDTPTFDIYDAGCCFRISLYEDEKGGFCRPRACFKGKSVKDQRGLISREEVEVPLPEPITKEMFFMKYSMIFSAKNIGEPFEKTRTYTEGHPHLWVIGGIKIHRRKYVYNDLLLEIDKVAFNESTCDYELEVETNRPEQTYPQIVTLLRSIEVEPVPSKQGKHGRFMNHKAKHGRETIFSW
jgi:uncharacterized protein YjbK